MEIKHIILTREERRELKQFSTTGVHSVRLVNRAKIILALDMSAGKKAQTQDAIAKCIGVSRQTVYEVKQDFLTAESVSMFLQRKKRATPPVPPKVTGELEARIIALACGEVPQGYARWTLRLLAEKCVELQYSDAMSHMTINRLLKKHNLNPI
jgi:transposase